MGYIEVGIVDRYVLAVEGSVRLEPWLEEGFKLLGRYERLGAFAEAMHAATLYELEPIWREVVGGPMPDNVPRRVIDDRLEEETDGDDPRLLILTRMVVCNSILEAVVYKPQEPVGPQRLSTDHYVVIETVNEQGHAVPSIRCELVIAGGEVRTVSTGPAGVVRVDRIQAGRVIIRVVDLDGGMWYPKSGEPAQLSAGSERSRVHVVRQGECLSRIAHQYGIKGWKTVWDDPKNEKLRKKRKNPNVLLPGDEVVVPGIKVHEIVRSTDQTHRIEVLPSARVTVRLNLLDEKREPIEDAPCKVFVDDEVFFEGKAQGGKLECELPVTASEVILIATVGGRQVERVLKVGALDPPDEISGIQARLCNLGWYDGEIDGKESQLLAASVREFRKDAGLNPGEQLDQPLFDALEQEHLV